MRRLLLWLPLAVCGLLFFQFSPVRAQGLDDLQRKLDEAKRRQAKPPAKPAAAGDSRLVISADADCELSINGERKGNLGTGQVRTFGVSRGQQLLVCKSVQSDATIQQIVEAKEGTQQVVTLGVASIVQKLEKEVRQKEENRASAAVAGGAGAQPSSTPRQALSASIRAGDFDAAERLVADNPRSLSFVGALKISIAQRSFAGVNYFFSKVPNGSETVLDNGLTALAYAATLPNNLDVIPFLLGRSNSKNSTASKYGWTAVDWANFAGNREAALFLNNAGVFPTRKPPPDGARYDLEEATQ